MNKQAARYGLFFYLITMVVAFIFPKKVFGNIMFIGAYFIICLIFLYFIFFRKLKNSND